VTYTADAQPIYAQHCSPCHSVDDDGGADFATSYADTQQLANAGIDVCTTSMTVGACTIKRIQAGEMPQGAGCTGNPTTDAGNTACLTAAEQATIQAWIDDGQLQ
jgi:hypothetical protein